MHVDYFIDRMYGREKYARWMLHYFRLPSALKADFSKFMKNHKLFCTHKNIRMRCTGASRLGYICLTSDHEQSKGYEICVDLSDCTKWSDKP